jgi:hypothetical protein
MANFIVRNSLNPYKIVKIGVTFSYVVPKNNEGEPIWVIELATKEKDLNGNSIPPEYINAVSLENIDAEIEKATAVISDKIDWGTLLDDGRAPFVDSHIPADGDSAVSIFQDVIINLKEVFPAEGIDYSSIKLSINGFDVTSELSIKGNPFSYEVTWKPFEKVFDTYL